MKRQPASRLAYLPWERGSADIAAPAHRARCASLTRNAGAVIDDTAFVADGALVFTETLTLGPGCLVAAQAFLRGHLVFGADCSINPFACLSGRVSCGRGVRIASHATLVGFDHGTDDPGLPIWKQPLVSRGIEVDDDVWIGAHAVILDGARIGAGAVVAAGAVVRGTVPPGAIVGGVPARIIRQRRAAKADADLLEDFARTVTGDWRIVLASYLTPDGYISADAQGRSGPAVRHLCDAIEIAAGFGDTAAIADRAGTVARLKSLQDPATGLFPDPLRAASGPLRDDPIALYNVLAVSNALACLGTSPAGPVHAVEIDAKALVQWLEALPWQSNPWGAGATVDAIGTALTHNARHFGTGAARDTLFGWLARRQDPATGLWGAAQAGDHLLAINGFYRATRGTYALQGLPVPRPTRVIDTVLSHYAAHAGFRGDKWTACNLLDVMHPLWLCLQQTDHRRPEVEAVARDVIGRILPFWQPGLGFPFATGHVPSLQGTEMWLSTLHTASVILRRNHLLPFVPRGIHRLAHDALSERLEVPLDRCNAGC